MPNWQAFLLGLMVAYTPGMIFLAVALHRSTRSRSEYVIRTVDIAASPRSRSN